MSDPAHTHAIIIGIEAYDLGEDWNLIGPASDALDCVEWLRQKGVPSTNITLLLAPTAKRKDAQFTRAATLGFAPAQILSPTISQVEQVFKDIRQTDGDFLVVFWGGHGVVDILNQRVLLCTDASANDRCDFAIDLARIKLTCDITTGFPEQIVMVDACANYVESLDWKTGIEIRVPSGLTRRDAVRQATVFACATGESAGQNQAGGYGEFSRVILTELSKDTTTLPPDMNDVAKCVRAHFAELKRKDPASQQPVYCMVQGFDQDTEEVWANNAHKTSAGARADDGLTLLQRGRLQAALMTCEGLRTRAQRDGMIAFTLPGDALSLSRSNVLEEDLNRCLHALESHQKLHTLFDWLEQDATGAAESRQLAAVDLRAMYNAIVRANKIRLQLNNLDLRTPAVVAAFLKTSSDRHSPVAPEDLAHALEILIRQHTDPTALHLARFALHLEHECPGDEKVAPSLLDALGADTAKANEIRQQIRSQDTQRARLIVDFYGANRVVGDTGWPQSLGAWVQHLDGSWSPFHEQKSDGTLDGAKKAFNEIVTWGWQTARSEPGIEIIVPRCLFDSDFENWEIQETIFTPPCPVGKRNALVLRWGERFHITSLQHSWRDRSEKVTKLLEKAKPNIHWVHSDEAADSAAVLISVGAKIDAHCIGFEFPLPDAPADLRFDPVVAALQTGAAYALWFRKGCDNLNMLKTSAISKLERDGVKDFPARLKTLRAEPLANETELSKYLIALWDDPFDLPSVGSATEPK